MKEFNYHKAKGRADFTFNPKLFTMAKKAKKIRKDKRLELKIVNPHAAGIDVSSTFMQVCVPLDRDLENNRKFGAFTEDLSKISEWLLSCRITTVAMESTGIYWVPLYMHLLEAGIEVYLVNAASVKNFVEEKTDEVDAESLMLMHAYGLLKPSYQVDNFARELRTLSRHRDSLIRTASKEVQHMQKSMDLMNIKLSNVISDITGKSGQMIIAAILSGERDAQRLAALADERCKNPKEVIAKSLVGNWNPELLFMLNQNYRLYLYLQQQIVDCEKEMEKLSHKYSCNLPAPGSEIIRSEKQTGKKIKVAFDVEAYGHRIFGVNLMRISGINEGTLLKLIGELGADFTEKFDSYKKFCRWENLAPNNKITGGKIISSKLPKRKNPVGMIFREAAVSASTSKSPLGDYYRRIRSRKGPMGAVVATANKISKIVYMMVKNKTEYDDKLIQINQPVVLLRKLTNMQKRMAKLQEQINQIVPIQQSADYYLFSG
jgi:transposase